MKPSFAQSLGAEFKQDDTLFNAALVSFGSFGIIHGLMIETRELFALNALRFKVPYDATLKGAITACDPTKIPLPAFAQAVPTDKPYHFELFLNPNEPAAPSSAFIQVMYETAFDPNNYVPPKWDGGESGLGADGLNVMGALVDNIPSPLDRLIVPMLNNEIENEFAPYLKKAIIRDLFRGEKTLGRTLACGVGMPANRAVEAMDIAFKRYATNGDVLPALLSVRFVKATKALLGFQRFEPTAVFEMDSVNTAKTRAYFEQVWADLDAAGIPFTLHWGKYNVFWTPAACAPTSATPSTSGSPAARRCWKPGGAADLQQPLHGRPGTGDLTAETFRSENLSASLDVAGIVRRFSVPRGRTKSPRHHAAASTASICIPRTREVLHNLPITQITWRMSA